MNSSEKTGDGKVVEIETGETIFKLDSHEKNPIVTPREIGLTWDENGESNVGAVFNGGAEVFEDKIILLPRCHRDYRKNKFFDEESGAERDCLENYISEIWVLASQDGIHFTRFQNVVIRGDGTDHQDFTYGIEDIRVIRHQEGYLLVGCGKTKPPFKGANADRIAVYTTKDFVNIDYHGMVESFDSRNAVPFPEPINGQHYVLLRFHPNIHLGHLEGGVDQLLNPFKHRDLWERVYEGRGQSLLLETGNYPHEKEKVGPSTQLIKTDKGWLLIYHAVGRIEADICKAYGLSEGIERGYSICAAILDLNDPRKVICRTRKPIYIPSAPYELYGNEQYPVDVRAVVFPVGALVRGNKMFIYAGAGDKYTILLTCNLDNLLNYLLEHCRL